MLLFPYGEEGWHPDLRHATLPAARQHAGEALAADEAEAEAAEAEAAEAEAAEAEAAEAEAAEAEAAEGDGQADTGPRRLTRLQYGAYRLMVCRRELNPILLSRRLGQGWIVDTYDCLQVLPPPAAVPCQGRHLLGGCAHLPRRDLRPVQGRLRGPRPSGE